MISFNDIYKYICINKCALRVATLLFLLEEAVAKETVANDDDKGQNNVYDVDRPE